MTSGYVSGNALSIRLVVRLLAILERAVKTYLVRTDVPMMSSKNLLNKVLFQEN